ncbi:MAG: hypothetical protein GXP27_11205 [Planctomycetes bacterium]|nr:hypothetical protein [Planctomycetota bacterium]
MGCLERCWNKTVELAKLTWKQAANPVGAVILVLLVAAGLVRLLDVQRGDHFVALIQALAWPTALCILLGYYFRKPLSDFLRRLERIVGPGVDVRASAAAPDAELQEILKRQQSSLATAEEQQEVATLLALPLPALRLLGTLVAVGLSQNLNLTLYRGPQFESAKRRLLDEGLARLDGQFYRPTLKGVRVFRHHVNALEERLSHPAAQGEADAKRT